MASPICAQQPAQQPSAEESREEFETRMQEVVSRLQMTSTSFFKKLVSRSMATEVVQGPFTYSLEFPLEFLLQRSKNFSVDATFVTTDRHQKWPIKITVRSFRNSRPRVFAFGLGGWKAFVVDNHIKVGDILIFKLLKFSYFEVVIGRSPILVHSDDDQDSEDEDNDDEDSADDADEDNDDEDNADDEDIVEEAPDEHKFGNELPMLPTFEVTIHRPFQPEHPENHLYLEKDLSLVVPSHFWKLHSHMLEGDELQLQGPTSTVTMVNVERTYNEEVQRVCLLHSGWKAFLLANNLGVGDVLQFSLVGNSSFKVDVIEWIENH